MAETKPMTTAGLPADRVDDKVGEAAERARTAQQPQNQPRSPGDKTKLTEAEAAKAAADKAAPVEQPSPTQAELDAMREGRYGRERSRDATAAGNDKVEYKTR